jgi:hypothetical protein
MIHFPCRKTISHKKKYVEQFLIKYMVRNYELLQKGFRTLENTCKTLACYETHLL